MKPCWEIGKDGNIIEHYLLEEQEISAMREKGKIMIDFPWSTPFSVPKFDFVVNDWVEGKSSTILLEELRKNKLAELNQKCNETIIGKFELDVNGITYYFSCDTEAQSNFEKVDRAFDKNRITEINWTAYDSDGNSLRLTIDRVNFESLYVAHLNHIQGSIARFRDYLQPLVEQATTKEELDSIVW